MSKLRLANKRGFKRRNISQKKNTGRHGKKIRRAKFEDENNASVSSASGESSEEQCAVASEEKEDKPVETYRELTMYDSLLKTLGSSSESLANAYKRRKREQEGQSDTEEDLACGSEYSSTLEEDDESEEGINDKSPRSLGMIKQGSKQGSGEIGVVEQNEDVAVDGHEAYETDDEHDLIISDQSTEESLTCTSAFGDHLGHKLSPEERNKLSERKWKYKWEAPAFDIPNSKWMGTGVCFIKDDGMNSSYDVNPRLYKHWMDIYKASGGNDFHSSRQRLFFSLCNSYRDILYHNKKPFYLKGLEDDSNIMNGYIVHTLNHVLRTRDLVIRNDARVAKHEGNEDLINGGGFLDHGFTRPKVLILLPLASVALNVVKRLIQLTPSKHKVNVEHLDRFSDEFGTGLADNDGNSDDDDIENKKSKPSKPADFQALFGGNNNDHFITGIKFTRRSIKLYADFYSSDIIVASPLGLITKIGEAEVEKEKDVDYLSSIEVLIIDHADVIAMQNWSHVNTVVEHLNRLPSKQHGTDIMRIRPWYLDGHAEFYRQTVILGSYLNPDINSTFNYHCLNYQGKLKLACEHRGVLAKVLLQVRQIYERFDAESLADVDDARLEYFAQKVFPKIKDTIQGGIMLFISSYFEFVRLRNFLKSQEASFCLLGEYTKQSDISRARVWFFQGKRKILLYTERAHFYHRYKIRGIQNVIIYSLPERKEFYPEIVNMLEDSHKMATTVIFSRFDQLRLERIVGSAAAKRMLTSEKSVFAFC